MRNAPRRKLVALHHQIYLTLRNELMRGHYSSAEAANPTPLPGELELAGQYGVSRMTVRQALAELEREGLIVRRHGAGTFPVPLGSHLRRTRDVESVYDEVTDLMQGYEQTIITFQRTRTPAFVASHCPDFGPDCLHLSVLSRHQGKPVHLNFQYIPGRLAKLIGRRPPSDVSLLLLLRRKGVLSESIELNLSATAADLPTAIRLDVQVGLPLIATRRLSRDATGGAIEFFEAVTRPDRYSYTFRFNGADARAAARPRRRPSGRRPPPP